MNFKVSEELIQPVPEVGKNYHFFDDGKVTFSRHSVAKVLRVVSVDEAKDILIKTYQCDDSEECEYIDKSVYENWENESKCSPWIMNEETDFFVECWIPQYDDNNIWFARSTDGGWFSFDVQSSWQSGRLDVNGKRYDDLKKNYNSDPAYNDCKKFFEQFEDLENFDFNSVKHYKE